MIDTTTLSDDDLAVLLNVCYIETARRRILAEEAQRLTEMQRQAQEARGTSRTDGTEWAAPTPGDNAALYSTGDVVVHNGQGYRGRVPYNHWEPGTDAGHAWEPVWLSEDGTTWVTTQPVTDPPPTAPANYKGEWSASARYEVDDVVSHDGFYWTCLVAHGAEYQGTWAPGLAHTVWTKGSSV